MKIKRLLWTEFWAYNVPGNCGNKWLEQIIVDNVWTPTCGVVDDREAEKGEKYM